jgi:hypothetical protein
MHLFVVLQVGERLIDNVISSSSIKDGSERSSAHIEKTSSFVLIRGFQADHADLDLASYISHVLSSCPPPAAAHFRTDCPKYDDRRASDLLFGTITRQSAQPHHRPLVIRTLRQLDLPC